MKLRRTLALCVLLLICAMCLLAAKPMTEKNIVGVASSNPNLSTLVRAIKAAGLADDLSKPGPFTVFAPTNDAFNKLPRATLQSLLKPENKAKLRSLLLYHVVKGHYMADDVMKMKSPAELTSVEGSKLRIIHNKSGVMVNNAKVTKADVMASNGVIHLINTVLMPPKKK